MSEFLNKKKNMYLPQHTTLCSKVNALQMTVHCMCQYSLIVTETRQIVRNGITSHACG